MKKYLALLLLLLLILPIGVCAQTTVDEDPSDRLGDLFFLSNNSKITEQVYVGGTPIGITIDGDGVMVVGLNEFVSEGGVVSPAITAGLNIGDVIYEVGGVKVTNVATLTELAGSSKGTELEVKFLRNNEQLSTTIIPKLDVLSNSYKLGIWAKDSSSGIGTLTYIRKNMQFGALGHPIVDSKTGEIVKVGRGKVYKANITDVVKGEKGNAGELKGVFQPTDVIGDLYINNKYGVYGNITEFPDNVETRLYNVASASEIKPGKAQILSTVDGDKPELFEIEIIRIMPQPTIMEKGLVLRITDQRLLEKTGGIVQGMSGSPILQEGKLVGAVTHVFVNEPTKGYGILAQWMLQN